MVVEGAVGRGETALVDATRDGRSRNQGHGADELGGVARIADAHAPRVACGLGAAHGHVAAEVHDDAREPVGLHGRHECIGDPSFGDAAGVHGGIGVGQLREASLGFGRCLEPGHRLGCGIGVALGRCGCRRLPQSERVPVDVAHRLGECTIIGHCALVKIPQAHRRAYGNVEGALAFRTVGKRPLEQVVGQKVDGHGLAVRAVYACDVGVGKRAAEQALVEAAARPGLLEGRLARRRFAVGFDVDDGVECQKAHARRLAPGGIAGLQVLLVGDGVENMCAGFVHVPSIVDLARNAGANGRCPF